MKYKKKKNEIMMNEPGAGHFYVGWATLMPITLYPSAYNTISCNGILLLAFRHCPKSTTSIRVQTFTIYCVCFIHKEAI